LHFANDVCFGPTRSVSHADCHAKTKLPELLREVQAGQRYAITLRGKPVAELVPEQRAGQCEIREAIAAMRILPRITRRVGRVGLDFRAGRSR
jgi:antitoxin (DNA-binding transcriptional repressor) of toxin-antitoxin stability system